MRTRRSIKKMARLNLERVKRTIERALASRDFLRNIESFRVPRPWTTLEVPYSVDGEEMAIDKPSKIKGFGVLILEQGSNKIQPSVRANLKKCLILDIFLAKDLDDILD